MQKETQPRTIGQIIENTHSRVGEFLAESKKAAEADRCGMKNMRWGYLGEKRFCLPEIKAGETIESGNDR